MLPAASPARPRLSPLELVTLAAEHCDHDSAIPVVTAAHGAPDRRSRAAARSPENGPPCWRAAGAAGPSPRLGAARVATPRCSPPPSQGPLRTPPQTAFGLRFR